MVGLDGIMDEARGAQGSSEARRPPTQQAMRDIDTLGRELDKVPLKPDVRSDISIDCMSPAAQAVIILLWRGCRYGQASSSPSSSVVADKHVEVMSGETLLFKVDSEQTSTQHRVEFADGHTIVFWCGCFEVMLANASGQVPNGQRGRSTPSAERERIGRVDGNY